MRDSNGTRVFNLLAVALLIQHVARVAHAAAHVSVSRSAASSSPSLLSSASAAAYAIGGTAGAPAAHASLGDADTDDDSGHRSADGVLARANAGAGVDFAAYVNDFNMQAEASIPEDILDQKHIEDADVIDEADSMQYAAGGGMERAADIILEAQRSSTSGKNFTSYNVHLNENNNKSNYNNNNGNDSQKQRKHNSNNLKQKNHYNKFQNNRDNKSNGDYDVAVAAAVATFDDNGDDDDMDLDVEFDAAVGAANNVDMGDGGAEFLDSSTDALVLAGNEHVASKKFTSADERQQQQRRQQQQLNAAASLEHMEVIEKFDEQGKFNKVSAQTTSQEANTPTANDNNYAPSSSNGNININRKSLLDFEDNDVDVDADADADGNQLQESAIGDIEDNFRDEDEDEATATAGREYKNVAAALATDETVAAEYPPAAQRSDDAPLSTAAFIARKIKRHNNDGRQQVAEQNRRNRRHRYGEADERDGQAENENAGSGAAAAKSAQSALYGGFSGDAMAERQQADYSINYFDNLTNGLNAQQQQQQPKSNSAAAAAGTQQQHSLAKIADGDDAEKIVGVLRAAYQQPEATAATTTAAVEAAALSAFELYKSQRRNSRRNGHRVHKKTYKDYLRYTGKYALVDRTTTNAATTTTAPSNAATESATPTQLTNSTKDRQAAARQADAETDRTHAEKLRKYARKLEAEKARGLPASPIFVVGANRKVAADADDQRTAKPFYEGQINYYMETKDGDDDTNAAAAIDGNTSSARQHDDKENLRRAAMGPHARSMERAIAADNSNWYRRVSPVLRNGVKTTSNNGNNEVKHAEGEAAAAQAERRHNHHQREHHHQQRLQLQHRQHQRQQHRQHRRPHGSHYYQHHHRSSHHKHHQHGKHYQSAAQKQQQQQQQQTQTNPYQRKSLPHEQRQPAGPYTSAHAASLAAYTAEAAASSAPSSLSASATATSTQTPLPLPPPAYKPHAGAMQELGHQITEMEEFERYYAKWPHLARVQFQVYDEHYREAHPELYPDYEDEDYESAAELEEAQSGTDEDANLPPYIKKYNRRNKQLLNLLEGTLPPATRSPALPRAWSGSVLQPGPHDSRGGSGSGAAPVRIDDDYLKEKRKRYHNRHDDNSSANKQYWRDLFAPQRDAAHSATDNNNSSNHSTAAAATQTQQQEDQPAQSTNQLPDENISISAPDSDAATDVDAEFANSVLIWPKEIENKSNANVELAGSAQMTWQIEKLTTAAPPTSTPKAAIFRLPSYPAIAGSFIGKPRSRSAQFAPSTSRGSAYTHASSSGFDLGRGGGVGRLPGKSYSSYNSNNANNYYKSTSRFSAYQPNAVAHETSYETAPPDHAATTPAATAVTGSGASSARTINSFVYHRVVDASPRLVGTGAAVGRKQRLPFVAITDRRLDTSSKKSLPKDFEQNHYPMP